jgi:hypothetical protein
MRQEWNDRHDPDEQLATLRRHGSGVAYRMLDLFDAVRRRVRWADGRNRGRLGSC